MRQALQWCRSQWQYWQPKGQSKLGQLLAKREEHWLRCRNHIPPYLVFPRVNVQDNWLLTAPPGSDASGHPKATGWMTEMNLVKYMKHVVQYAKPSQQSPILLLLDNHQSHLSIEIIDNARAIYITMLSFPPHCSHRLQPLDVSVYGPQDAVQSRMRKLDATERECWKSDDNPHHSTARLLCFSQSHDCDENYG